MGRGRQGRMMKVCRDMSGDFKILEEMTTKTLWIWKYEMGLLGNATRSGFESYVITSTCHATWLALVLEK